MSMDKCFGVAQQLANEIAKNVSTALPTIPTPVGLQFALYSVVAIHELRGTAEFYLWLRQRWVDPAVRWNPSDFCGISTSPVKTSPDAPALFKPDIEIYNQVNELGPSEALPVAFFNGTFLFSRPMIVEAMCTSGNNGERPFNDSLAENIGRKWPHPIELTKFPYDIQPC